MAKRVDWFITELNIIGGTEIFLRQTAPLLREVGWDLRVITLVSSGVLIDELRHAGIPVIELGLKHKLDLSAVGHLVKIWREDPPDLIHTHLYHAGILGRCVAHLLGISPVLVHQHGPEAKRSRFRVRLDGLLSRWVDRYVSTCQAVSRVLEKREGIPATKIEVIYNGISLPTHVVDLVKPRDWPTQPKGVTLICVGRLSPEKGQHVLLDALANLRDSFLPVHTIFVGDGTELESLLARCKQLGLNEQVTFVGLKADVIPWLLHADIFVLPSDWEGVSLALLEAMVAGLPVIATDVGGTPEVVMDGKTGILVPPRDPQKLAVAISQLAANPKLRQRLGHAGKIRVQQHFSIQETVQKFDQLYTKLLEKP